MAWKTQKLHKRTLNQLFVESLGNAVQNVENINSFPVLIDLKRPFPLRLRVYLFNCTNPPGGRSFNEFKIQIILPGQKPRCRASLDYSDGRMPILAAYASLDNDIQNGVFVVWDAHKHNEFSYSSNMQVKFETIVEAMCVMVAESSRNNAEIVLAARPKYLLNAIKRRVAITHDTLMEDVNET